MIKKLVAPALSYIVGDTLKGVIVSSHDTYDH
jgi:hypothetical protein